MNLYGSTVNFSYIYCPSQFHETIALSSGNLLSLPYLLLPPIGILPHLRSSPSHFAGLLSNRGNFHFLLAPHPGLKPEPLLQDFFPGPLGILRPRSGQASCVSHPSSAMGAQGASVPPPGGARSLFVRLSEDPLLLISPGAPSLGQPLFSRGSPTPSEHFLRRPYLEQVCSLSPGTPATLGLPTSLGLGPLPVPLPPTPHPALSTRAAAGLPGFPFSLTPKPSWVFPTHPALGAGRYRSPPSLGPWPLPFPQITYSPHTGRRSAPQTGAAGRPKGPPALTRVGPALAYLPRENSAARSPAILPVAQSARTRRHPRRLRPGPGPGPDPKSRPPSSDLRLRSAELEIPPRDGHQISYPRYRHSPAAAPDQLKRHCLYLGRQWPPSATTSPMTTGPPSFILLTYPLDNGAAALLSDWLNLPARHRSLPPLFLKPVFAPARTWSVLAQALVVIG